MQIIVKTIFLISCFFISLAIVSQTKEPPNKAYSSIKNFKSFPTVFPVEEIQSISVENFAGTHTLTNTELNSLKAQLMKGKYINSIATKPGHITLKIQMKENSKAQSGFVYAYNGRILFKGATDSKGNRFTGTCYLPCKSTSIITDNSKDFQNWRDIYPRFFTV